MQATTLAPSMFVDLKTAKTIMALVMAAGSVPENDEALAAMLLKGGVNTNAQPPETVEADEATLLGRAILDMPQHLPEEWSVHVNINGQESWVTLCDPCGIDRDAGLLDTPLHAQVERAATLVERYAHPDAVQDDEQGDAEA